MGLLYARATYNYESKWVLYISRIVDCGFPGVWNAQRIPNSFECFKEMTRWEFFSCKHPRRLPLSLSKKSYTLIIILPDNQFVHVIIK